MQQNIQAGLERQREFFRSGATRSHAFRFQALDALYETIAGREQAIEAALFADMGKSRGESWLTETGIVLAETGHARKRLKAWMRPRRARTPLALFPARSRIIPEPFGVVLVMAPWNYPLQLSLVPLINAVAAGNCVVLKPSSRAPATVAVLEKIINDVFDSRHVRLVQGDAKTGGALLEERFDFIFYTGSTRVGRTVMEAAGRGLTPVCLELGGKSPVIVCADADLELAARRIAWGKALNAGQTCVAPDYVLAHQNVKTRLVALLRENFARFPGPDALHNDRYCRIISGAAMDRLDSLAKGQAGLDRQTGRMAPLVMPDARPDDPVMQEEIFGPLLPVLSFSHVDEALGFVREREKPLACYVFSRSNEQARHMMDLLSFGGGCINDTIMHAGSHALPFGGVGASGMGRYHGKAGFELFSNMKSVVLGSSLVDPPLRYPPYSGWMLALLKRILR